jgi:hypothetical protein
MLERCVMSARAKRLGRYFKVFAAASTFFRVAGATLAPSV